MGKKGAKEAFVTTNGQANMDVADERGSLTSQMNDSIGLDQQKLRGSEEKELTLS